MRTLKLAFQWVTGISNGFQRRSVLTYIILLWLRLGAPRAKTPGRKCAISAMARLCLCFSVFSNFGSLALPFLYPLPSSCRGSVFAASPLTWSSLCLLTLCLMTLCLMTMAVLSMFYSRAVLGTPRNSDFAVWVLTGELTGS